MNQVLMITSDPILGRNITRTLSESNYKVNEVSTGLDGLLMVSRNTYEVVIIDEEIPDISSHNLCRKANEYTDSPIILLGSEPTTEIWSRSEELGFNVYLNKPISPDEVTTYVTSLIKPVHSNTMVKTEKRNTIPVHPIPLIKVPAIKPAESVNLIERELPFQERKPVLSALIEQSAQKMQPINIFES